MNEAITKLGPPRRSRGVSQVSPLSVSSRAPQKPSMNPEPAQSLYSLPCTALLNNSEFKTEENLHINLKWAFIFFITCPGSGPHSLPSEGRKDEGVQSPMDCEHPPCCRLLTRLGDRAGDKALVRKLGLQVLLSQPGENYSTRRGPCFLNQKLCTVVFLVELLS